MYIVMQNLALCKYEYIVIAVDTNNDINLLKNTTESMNVNDFCDIFDLRNNIKEPICIIQKCKTLIIIFNS